LLILIMCSNVAKELCFLAANVAVLTG